MRNGIADRMSLVELQAIFSGLVFISGGVGVPASLGVGRGCSRRRDRWVNGRVIEGHIRFHVVDLDHHPTSERAKATQELIDVIKMYMK